MLDLDPKVSIVMTVWNGEKYIAETIRSVLDQTFKDFELIIVDDGSSDGTCAVVESFIDRRIRLIKRPWSGVVPSANFGAAQAKGKYVARLDADDISLPDRLELQVRALDQSPGSVMSYTNVTIFGENILNDLSPEHREARFVQDTGLALIKMCFQCPFIHSSVMFRKIAFDTIGGYLDKHPCEDYDLYTRLIRRGSFVGIPRKLVRYRRHSQSATSRRPDEMAKFTREIAVGHTIFFLRISPGLANDFYGMLRLPAPERSLALWLLFFSKILSLPQCWRPEPLGWLISQTLRSIMGKLRARRNIRPAS